MKIRGQAILALPVLIILCSCRSEATADTANVELSFSTPSPSPTPMVLPSETIATPPTLSPTSTPTKIPTPEVITRDNIAKIHRVDRVGYSQSGFGVQFAAYSPDGHFMMVQGYSQTAFYGSGTYETFGTITTSSRNLYHELFLEEDILLDPLPPQWSPDSSMVAFIDARGSIKVYSIPALDLISTISSDRGPLYVFDWSPDSEQIVAADNNNDLVVWDVMPSKETLRLSGHGGFVHQIKWSPSGTQIASASKTAELFIWDLDKERIRVHLGEINKPVLSMEWHPSDPRLATTTGEQNYIIWNTVTGEPSLSFFVLHPEHFRSGNMVWSADGRLIAYYDDTRTVYIKNGRSGDMVALFYAVGGEDINISSDGKFIARYGGGVYQTASGARILEPDDLIGNEGMAWSPTENVLLLWNQDRLQAWNLATNDTSMIIDPELGSVGGMRLSPDAEKIAFLENTRGISVFAGSQQYFYPIDNLNPWDTELEWIADSERVAIPVPDGTIHVWNPFTNEVEVIWTEYAREIAASPIKNLLVVGRYDGRVEVWDVDRTGFPDVLAMGAWNSIQDLTFSPDGTHVAAVDADGFLSVFDVGLGKRIKYQSLFPTTKGQPPTVNLEWIPNTQNLVLFRSQWDNAERDIFNELSIISVETSEVVCILDGEYGFWLSASPRGDLLITGEGDVFDTATCERVAELEGGLVAWLPDQTGLITYGGDLSFWSLTGPQIESENVWTETVQIEGLDGDQEGCIWWSECGTHIYSDNPGGSVGEDRVYDQATGEILAANTLVFKPDGTFLAYLNFGDINRKFEGTYEDEYSHLLLYLPEGADINPVVSYTVPDKLVWHGLADIDLILIYRWTIK